MKILICPDKFKGSLTANEVIEYVAAGINRIIPNAEIISKPMADGGEGSLDMISSFFNCNEITTTVKDPLFRDIKASYYSNQRGNAFVEMARASGLALLTEGERNCMHTTSFGTGQLIKHAKKHGAKTIYLFVGGSATCDAGLGMAEALGYEFFDEAGNRLSPIGLNMSKVHSFKRDSDEDYNITILVDVNNPFYGSNGAAHVFGPQKGANKHEVEELDKGLSNLARLINKEYKIDLQQLHGAGAAGGIAGGSYAFFGAKLKSGIEFFIEHTELESAIKSVDLIISGEGKVDNQTWEGKVVSGVMKLCNKHGKNLLVVCGVNQTSTDETRIHNIIQLQDENMSKKHALTHAGELLESKVEEYFREKF